MKQEKRNTTRVSLKDQSIKHSFNFTPIVQKVKC